MWRAGIVLLLAGCSSSGSTLTLPAPSACVPAPEPHALVDGRTCSQGIFLVDDQHLYWSEDIPMVPVLFSMSKCGDAPVEVAAQRFGALVLDQGAFLAITDDSLVRLPLDGGATRVLTTGFSGAAAIALEPGHDTVLVGATGYCFSFHGPDCDLTKGLLWRVNRAGGEPVMVTDPSVTGLLQQIVEVGDWIYATGYVGNDPGLWRISLAGASVEELRNGTEHLGATSIVADPSTGEVYANGVYGLWVIRGTELHRIDIDGPDRDANYGGLAIDQDYVYALTAGRLVRAPRAGGAEKLLLDGDAPVVHIGLDQTAVYAHQCGGLGGRIVAFAR